MWHLLVWTLVALAAGLWSLACWATHALLTGPDWAAADPGAWLAWLEQWQIPLWLAAWLPMEAVTLLKTWLTGWLSDWGPWLDELLVQAPDLLGWLAPLLWVAWGLGLLLLAGGGLAGSLLVAALRRSLLPRTARAATP